MNNSSMIYEGDWQDGIIQGNGKIRWTTGNFYEGEFKNNRINGNGYLVWYDSSEKYLGQWTDTLQNGLGIHIWYESKGEQKYLRNRYVGEWRNGFRHGYGVFFYSNGSKYEGLWDQNYKHGFGVFTFYDGSQYIGRFHNDRMLDFNSSGIYAPISLNKIQEQVPSNTGRNISTANKNNKKSNANQNSLIKEENEVGSGGQSQGNSQSNSTHGGFQRTNSSFSNNDANQASTKKIPVKDFVKESQKILEEIPENNESILLSSNNVGSDHPQQVVRTGARGSTFIGPGAYSISQHSSMIGTTNLVGSNQNNNLNINNNNLSSIQQADSGASSAHGKSKEGVPVVSTRTLNSKDAELNQFKTSLDITDIIECEPNIESSLKEVENILLRHLTEIKDWYNKYLNKIEKTNKDEFNTTNASMMHNVENSRVSGFAPPLSVNLKDDKTNYNEENTGNNRQPSMTNLNEKEKNNSMTEGVYNNDLGFCMEMKDMWKFMRESNILSSEFTLAQFNRIFFKGPKNFIEMFLCPEDLDQKLIYDYVYLMINKSREEFIGKYKYAIERADRLRRIELGDFGISIVDTMMTKDSKERDASINSQGHNISPNSSSNNLNYKSQELEVNFDLHNKHNVVLLRHFYEAIVRIAYMKYFHINQPLSSKLKLLIENCIRLNPLFIKKTNAKRSFNNTTETSMNMSVLDMKVKSYENSLENFFKEHENVLKPVFKSLYNKSTINPKKNDMTITYRFFYENVVLRSSLLRDFLEDKLSFIGLINIYHKDRIVIIEDNKHTKEIFTYSENLLDCEFIFYEFCEMTFYITRKYFLKNNLPDKKESYLEVIKHIKDVIKSYKHVSVNSDKMKYHYPTLQNHIVYDAILESKRLREEEDKRKQQELKRIELERKLMAIEDLNVIPENIENNEDQSSYSDDYDH